MPTHTDDYTKVEQARKKSASYAKSAGTLEAGAQTFGDDVMEQVRARRAERGISSLGRSEAETAGRLATYGPNIEQRMQGVDPLSVDAVRGQERSDILTSLEWIANAMTEQEGTITDITDSGTNKIKAMAVMKQAEADAASEEANNLLEMIKAKQAESQREFERQMSEKRYTEGVRQFNVSQSKKGGAGGGSEDVWGEWSYDINSGMWTRYDKKTGKTEFKTEKQMADELNKGSIAEEDIEQKTSTDYWGATKNTIGGWLNQSTSQPDVSQRSAAARQGITGIAKNYWNYLKGAHAKQLK